MSPVIKKLTAVLVLLFLLNACQRGPVTQPPPSVAQIGSDLNCPTGDHPFEDGQAGWGFCYPGTWQYLEKSNSTTGPVRLDLLLYFTKITCVPGTPDPSAPRPVCSPGIGSFGLVVVSTFENGSVPDLATWMQANLNPVPKGQAIQWANALEALQLSDGRRLALTQHHVVLLDLRATKDGLDLEAQLSTRISNWKFLY